MIEIRHTSGTVNNINGANTTTLTNQESYLYTASDTGLAIRDFSNNVVITYNDLGNLDLYDEGVPIPTPATFQDLSIQLQDWLSPAAPGGTSWGAITGDISNQSDLQLEFDEKQDIDPNTVIIRSESDFPLPVGGLSTLDSTKFYEVQGNVEVSFNIDPDGATISGRDRSFDELINTQANAKLIITSGNVNISKLLLSTTGSGAQVFDVTGGGTSTVVLNECSVSNSTDLGVLDSCLAVQFAGTVFQTNTAGITLNDCSQIASRSTSFIFTTGGTQMTVTGNVALFQMTAGGGFNNAVGTTGLSVAGITSLALFGQISGGVTFTGAGTSVDDETVFDDPKWTVDAPGVDSIYKDTEATGNVYITTPATTIIIAGNPSKVAGTTTAGDLFRFDDDGGTNNRLKYLGTEIIEFTVIGTLTLDTSAGFFGDQVSAYIYKNGLQLPESQSATTVPVSASAANLTTKVVTQLEPNDYVEVWVGNDSNNNNISVEFMNLSVL